MPGDRLGLEIKVAKTSFKTKRLSASMSEAVLQPRTIRPTKQRSYKTTDENTS